MSESMAVRDGRSVRLPGLASAHSHAFQRGLRGRTQRATASGSFWSWRALMYRFAEGLDPDSLYALSRLAFRELARNGVTAVGEFHYVHHQAGGRPYDDRVILADAVVRAARDVGLRITLLRVLYARGAWRRDAEGAQARFIDQNIDDALADVETLMKRYGNDDAVRVGIAPHSVRAVPKEWWSRATAFAEEHELPLHAHVAEQRREISECLAEHGRRPVELLHELGVIGPRFVAVHATHLLSHEAALLAPGMACICRTTERDLGDGSPDVSRLTQTGVRVCMGVDSHARSDPFEELRAIELDERVRTQRRQVAFDGSMLLAAGSSHGYTAIGQGSAARDAVFVDLEDVSLAGASESKGPALDDAVVFGADGRAVTRVEVDGRALTLETDAAERSAFEDVVRRLADG